ncbi:MAG TPA: TetR family transcriptional regulator [Actinomycetes bacterium]
MRERRGAEASPRDGEPAAEAVPAGKGQARPRRSDRTRASILEAARHRFARDGYERATIRAIAADARIDPSMVMRYFGSKQGLFTAAAEIDLRLPDLRGAPRSRLGERLVAHFLSRWEGVSAALLSQPPGPGGEQGQVDEALLVLLRAAVTNEDAAERMRTMLLEQVAPAVAAVAPDLPEARTGMVTSQILGLALCRHVLRLPAVAELDHDTLVARFGPTIRRYLTGRLPR